MFNYCEQCYECIDIEECYGCTKSQELRNCRDCHFSYALTGCDPCIACSNLSHKKYHIFNKEYPEEDFEKMKRKIFNGEDANWQVGCDHFDRIYRNALHNQYRNLKCENVVGDYVLEGKDCFQVFDVRGCEKCRYSVSI